MHERVPNRLELLCSKGMVVSVKGKVGAEKMNESEPLLKCRKFRNDVKTEDWTYSRDQLGGNVHTGHAASGIEVA